jgi:hypothetical protein
MQRVVEKEKIFSLSGMCVISKWQNMEKVLKVAPTEASILNQGKWTKVKRQRVPA